MARESIFISYRHDDTIDVAGRIYDVLGDRFGADKVFKDVDNIPPGAKFDDHIKTTLSQCRVALVLIGPNWAGAGAAGGSRLDDAEDLVRIEVETALARDVYVVPVLVNGAQLPRPDQLPPSLRPLLGRQAAIIRRDPDFRDDMKRLVQALRSNVRSGIDLGALATPQQPAARKLTAAKILTAVVLAAVVTGGAWLAYPHVARLANPQAPELAQSSPTEPTTDHAGAEQLNGQTSASDHAQLARREFVLPTHAATGRLYVLAVSRHSGELDWAALSRAGIRFAYFKASQSESFADPTFRSNVAGARANNIRVGAYHFFSATTPANAQMRNFLAEYAGVFRSDDLPPVLDLEWDMQRREGEFVDRWQGVASNVIADNALIWLTGVEERLQVRPIIYTNATWWNERLATEGARLNAYHFWISDFAVSSHTRGSPRIPAGATWMLWQFTDRGSLAGRPENSVPQRLDLSVANPNLQWMLER